jgi:hypothetical protein
VHFWKLELFKLYGSNYYLEWLKRKQLILFRMHCTNSIFVHQQCANAQLIDSNFGEYLRRISKHKKWTFLWLANWNNAWKWVERLLRYICMQLYSFSCAITNPNSDVLDNTAGRSWCSQKTESLYVFDYIYTFICYIFAYVYFFEHFHGILFIGKLLVNSLWANLFQKNF